MSAPPTSIPAKMLAEQGAEALLRFVGECGGVTAAGVEAGGSSDTWQRALKKAREQTGQDWRDFARPEDIAGRRPRQIGLTPSGEGADSSVSSLAKELDEALIGIDLSKAERLSGDQPDIEIVAGEMEDRAEDDESTAPKKVPKSWEEERVPRLYEGGLHRSRVPEPAPDAPAQEWCDYLTVIADFHELVHSARLRTVPGKRYAGIIPVADLHLGKEGCLFRKFRALVQWVCDHDGYYLLGVGDLLNNPTLGGPEADQLGAQTATVGQSGRALAYALAEAAQKNKIIALLTGNHEQRMVKATGQDVDPTQRLADTIGVPYAGYEAPFVFEVGDETYTLYANHGTGGGQTMGYIFNTLERMSMNHRANCVVMAHRHVKIVHERGHLEVEVASPGEITKADLDSKNPIYEYREHFDILIGAGCFVREVPSSFGRKMTSPPPVAGTVTVRCYADKNHIHARI